MSYLSQYDSDLAHLTALNSPQPAVAPLAYGPSALQAPPVQQGPSALAQPAPEGPSALQPPSMTAGDLWRQLPQQHKDEVAKSVVDSGHSVEGLYQLAVKHGDIPPAEKAPTKDEMLGYLTEVALRTAQNMAKNRSGNSFGDFAQAKLETDDKRAALAKEEQEKTDKKTETLRQETRQDTKETSAIGREDAREARQNTRTDSAEARRRADEIARFDEDAKLRRDLAEKEIASRTASAKLGRQKQTLTGDDGTVVTLNDDNTTTQVNKPGTDEPFRVADKDLAKQTAIATDITKEATALTAIDNPFFMSLKKAGYSQDQIAKAAERKATDLVNARYDAAKQIRKPPGAAAPAVTGVPQGSTRLGKDASGKTYYRAPDGKTYTSME